MDSSFLVIDAIPLGFGFHEK